MCKGFASAGCQLCVLRPIQDIPTSFHMRYQCPVEQTLIIGFCEKRSTIESMQQAPMDSWSMLLYAVKASILRLGRSLFLPRGMIEW